MRKLTKQVFVDRSNKIHNNKYDYAKSVYVGTYANITIKCPYHGYFKQSPKNHMNGHGCRKCHAIMMSDIISSTTHEFINKARTVHGPRYNYNLVSYVSAKKKVIIVCPTHGNFMQTPTGHLGGKGCIECAGVRKSNTLEFITKAKLVHGDRYSYEKTNYKTAFIKITVNCVKHGAFKITPNNHLRGKGCPVCNFSSGEREVAKTLTKLGLTFIPQYKISGTHYRYDFYIPKLKLLIEYDGIQHYKSIEFFGGDKSLARRKLLDTIKTSLALVNNLHLIRVPYHVHNTISKYIIFKIGSIYKYRVGSNWYTSFTSLCYGENLSKETLVKDVIMYKLSNNGRST